jgi:hypothetical protein
MSSALQQKPEIKVKIFLFNQKIQAVKITVLMKVKAIVAFYE